MTAPEATTQSSNLADDERQAIRMIGDVFGIIFLEEPFSERSREVYELLGELDPQEASQAWPFVAEPVAHDLLAQVHDALGSSSQDDLILEYRRLFVGPARKAAPPWGSVYLDKDQVIFGISTLELRRWMRENGIGKTTADEEPEDHIGRMLLMMSWMAANRPELLPSFLEDHLLPWAPHFLELVDSETSSPFLSAIAQLCRQSLQGIQEALALDVPEVRFYR